MKISKDCGFDEGCFSFASLLETDNSYGYENFLESLQSHNAYMVAPADGNSLAFVNKNVIRVDIDGPYKGKNQIGNDNFLFVIDENVNYLYPGIQPEYLHGDFYSYADEETAWVIENGNLDYLKCPDELNWETKTSCE